MNVLRTHRRAAGGLLAVAGFVVAMAAIVPAVGASSGSAPDVGGRLRIEKRVQGVNPPSGPFEFHARCTSGNETLDQDFTINAGGFAAWHRLPVGAVCVVQETNNGGAASTIVKPASATVVIPDDDSVKVAFINVFEATTTTSSSTSTTSTTTTSTSTTTTTAPATTTTTVSVKGEVLTRPAPPPAPAPAVLPAELPRTGTTRTIPLALAGVALMALGIVLRRGASRRTT